MPGTCCSSPGPRSLGSCFWLNSWSPAPSPPYLLWSCPGYQSLGCSSLELAPLCSKGCDFLLKAGPSITIRPFVVILINSSNTSVLLRPRFLFSSDSSVSPSSPPGCWFPRLLAGSSESFLSRAMTGFLWQVVFWLKTAVIQRALPPARRPGKRTTACVCVRGSEKAWAGAHPSHFS